MSRSVQTGDKPAAQALNPRKLAIAGAAFGLLTALSGCNEGGVPGRAQQPLSREMLALMQKKGVSPQAPMLIRAYKKDSEIEVWKMKPDGTYILLKTFPICRWSGQLGPKTREGDRQSPEGFYAITPAMMNPNSSYYLSFNIGYPNAYDRAHGATGGSVMVHGVCSSAGCFSMTDAQIAEIYTLARESFAGGQRAIQMQAYPFHFTPQNLAKYRLDPNMPFWKDLKKGDEHFEATKMDVAVNVCGGRYVFDAKSADGQPLQADAPCPPLKFDPEIESKAAQIRRADEVAVAELVARGERPVRLVYRDGAQHPVFADRVAEVSRPEALTPPVEVAMDETRGHARPASRASAMAATLAAAAPGATAVARHDKAAPSLLAVGLRAATPRALKAGPIKAEAAKPQASKADVSAKQKFASAPAAQPALR